MFPMSGVPYQKARYTCPGSILPIKPGISNHNNPSPTRFGVPSALMCKGLLGEEDGTTGTQEVPRSMPRSYWQLRFENFIAVVAPTTLHIPIDNLEVYSPHLYGDLQTNRIIASRLWSVYSFHVKNSRVRGWLFGGQFKSGGG
ncbi:hypothetical protein BU17DRAFT_70403 [Hysterangium stoloniferum]|nr:hypothetical protein BU17DRAFT_70403 [Hysterangium stoloniferum]